MSNGILFHSYEYSQFSSFQCNFGIFGVFLLKITHFISVPSYRCVAPGILSLSILTVFAVMSLLGS